MLSYFRFFVLAAGLVLSSPTVGADAPIGEADDLPEAPPIIDTTDWGGFYFGGYGSYTWISANVSTGTQADGEGADFGLYAGYNWQFNPNFVGGLEARVGLSGADASTATIAIEKDWDASIRARMGYAFERSLIYSFAGLAVTSLDAASVAGSDSQTLSGWNVGAGWEQDLGGNWSARLEYGFADYSSENFALGGGGATQIDLEDQNVTLGIGLRF